MPSSSWFGSFEEKGQAGVLVELSTLFVSPTRRRVPLRVCTRGVCVCMVRRGGILDERRRHTALLNLTNKPRFLGRAAR